jgi:aspartyl-tRNA(Asn)/glutamyl-tRNA(Gln) amidotransferase subunit A
MPVGLQIVGRGLGEADVLRAAAAIERTQPPDYNLRPFTGQ